MICLSLVYMIGEKVNSETRVVGKSDQTKTSKRESHDYTYVSVQPSLRHRGTRVARLQDFEDRPSAPAEKTHNGDNQHLSNYEHGIYSSLMKILNNVKHHTDKAIKPKMRASEAEVQSEPALIDAAAAKNLEPLDYIRNNPRVKSARQVNVDGALDSNISRHTDDRILDLVSTQRPLPETTGAPSLDSIERLAPLSTVLPSSRDRSPPVRPVYSPQIFEDTEDMHRPTSDTAKGKPDAQIRLYESDNELGARGNQAHRSRSVVYLPGASDNYEVVASQRPLAGPYKRSKSGAQNRFAGRRQPTIAVLRTTPVPSANEYTDTDGTFSDSSGEDDDREKNTRTSSTGSFDYNTTQDYMPSRTTERQFQAHPNGVVLQQIYPTRAEETQSRYTPVQAAKSYLTPGDTLQSFANNRIGMTLHQSGSQPALGSIDSLTPTVAQSSQVTPQRDLLHQPQTIQITAVPNINAWGQNNALVRLNGFQLNGLSPLVGGINPGWQQFGIDPFGRQVLALGNGLQQQADRRIDWSFWIWPIIAVVSLPLLLGALFVPIFLKTVVILIQLLQSLGLLIPITSAMSNQLANAVVANQSDPLGTKGS